MPLHFKKTGEGAPVVLIHGLFGSLENLGAIARFLSKQFTVFSLDLPNHGKSLHTDSTDLNSMCMLVKSWMEEHNLDSAHILGHSLGGKVAMELALNFPRCVDRLVVIDIAPVTYPARHNDVFGGLLSFDPNSIESRHEADAHLREHVEESAVRSFLLKNLVKVESGFEWRMNLPVIHQAYQNLISENRTEREFLGEVLFLKGANSDYIQKAHREAIESRFPNTSLKVIDNTGHWLHAEKPEIVSKIITRFFTGA